ncbi:MAG TPA: hypothetical protein VMP01_15860 [Pirellulaceae bacterium]|nr:hypothetical protein [Pirellulaceae bacterium]
MNMALLRWLRLVAPPAWITVTLLAWCAIMEGIYAWIGSTLGWQALSPRFFVARDVACLAAAAYLGVYRIAAFHPLFDSDYLSWLWLTPWRYDKPLPRGPLHLVLQDVLTVGLITAFMLHRPVVPLEYAPLSFFVTYYLTLALSLWGVDLRWWGYAVSALTGLMIAVSGRSSLAGLAVAALVYIPAYAGVRWTLATFPWSQRTTAWRKGVARQWQIFTAGHRQFAMISVNLEHPETEVHWPYSVLHAKERPSFFGKGDRLALALLAGWWCWVIFSTPGAEEMALGIGPMLYVMLLGFVVSARLIAYCGNHRPPISFWGRVFTLRWIIPGYDKVFLTPLATLGLGIVFPIALAKLQFEPPLILALSFPPFLIAGMLGGPPLAQWRLTSPARLAPGVRNQQLVEEI